jgi:hypothetical protein
VRGNFVEGISDFNLLIILKDSTPSAHQAIAQAIGANPRLDPFILGKTGLERSARAFAPKFASIKRNYRVLLGADPLASLTLEADRQRFLCEQALRNLRLRLVHAFVTRQHNRAYAKFLARSVTPIFSQLSEALRLNGTDLPKEVETRIGVLEKELALEHGLLKDLLAFKAAPRSFSDGEAEAWHGRVFPMLDAAVKWIEAKWLA